MNKMDILIRDVEPVAIKKIDELAKLRGISRNEFLKNYLEKLSVLDTLKDYETRFEESLASVTLVLKNQTKEIKDMKKLISHVSGITEDELKQFYYEFENKPQQVK